MENDVAFERLTLALAQLNQADLQLLLKAIDDLQQQNITDSRYRGQVFEAKGDIIPEQSSLPKSAQDMLQAIPTLNPAQLKVLSSLIPSYFDGLPHNASHVSASWGTANPAVAFASNVNWSSPEHISHDEILRRGELFKSVMALVESAQRAKTAGDDQLATELFQQAMDFLKEQNVSEPMLEYLRRLFQK